MAKIARNFWIVKPGNASKSSESRLYYEGEDRKEYLRLVHAQFMYTVLLIQEKDSKRVLSPLYVFAERLDRDFSVNSKFDENVFG